MAPWVVALSGTSDAPLVSDVKLSARSFRCPIAHRPSSASVPGTRPAARRPHAAPAARAASTSSSARRPARGAARATARRSSRQLRVRRHGSRPDGPRNAERQLSPAHRRGGLPDGATEFATVGFTLRGQSSQTPARRLETCQREREAIDDHDRVLRPRISGRILTRRPRKGSGRSVRPS